MDLNSSLDATMLQKCFACAKCRAFLTDFSILYNRFAQCYYIEIDANVTLIIKLCVLTVCSRYGGELLSMSVMGAHG